MTLSRSDFFGPLEKQLWVGGGGDGTTPPELDLSGQYSCHSKQVINIKAALLQVEWMLQKAKEN